MQFRKWRGLLKRCCRDLQSFGVTLGNCLQLTINRSFHFDTASVRHEFPVSSFSSWGLAVCFQQEFERSLPPVPIARPSALNCNIK